MLRSRDWLSAAVVRLMFEPEGEFSCHPGQFLSLIDPDSMLSRSYSVAGVRDGLIELHVRVLPGGRMSTLVSSVAEPGYRMNITGPSGSCFYDATNPDRRIVLAGTGTGLAPLWGILQDALAHAHRGPISLYHGALDRSGLYQVDELQALQTRHQGFHYIPSVRDSTDPSGSDLVSVVTRGEKQLTNTTFYLCGDEVLFNRLKRTLFLAGAKLDALRADPFVAAREKRTG